MGRLALIGIWVLSVIVPGIYDARTGQAVTLQDALQGIGPGAIVVVGEHHDSQQHHENELVVLQSLAGRRLPVSVGLEFLAYPDQSAVDRFVRGEIPESEFLAAVRWGAGPFAPYRPLILFPRDAGGETLALNAPERLTRAIAQSGLDALSAEERGLLPPGFTLGNALYFERFARDVQQHGSLSEAAVRNYFAAQSAWDDTMAWRAVSFISAHPDQVLVIVVGDFHVAYGGGLPDRLRARGAAAVWTISQVGIAGRSEAEVQTILTPDPRYGPRADFVWLTGP